MGITNAHSLVNKLITIGLTNNQVELVTEIVDQFVTKNEFNDISKVLATKTDLAELKTEFKSDISELRTEFKSDIANLRAELKSDIATIKIDMLKWLLPFLLTIIGLVMSVFIKLIV